MAVSAPGDSPIDSAWRTRVPQGWIQFPDGSFGPPNQVGSDWNAPYRTPPVGGGAGPPAGSTPPPPGVTLNTTGGGPPATTGPDIIPPQNSTIPNNKSVGPFTGGTSTENGPTGSFGDPYSRWENERPWQWSEPKAGGGGWTSNFTNGPRIDPSQFAGGSSNPLGWLRFGRGGALGAGAAIMNPTPAETGEFNPPMVAGRPDAPMSSVHGLPAAAPQTYPHMPWPPGAPQASAAPKKGRISPASVNLGRGVPGAPAAPAMAPGWGVIDRPNMSASNGPGGQGGRGGGGGDPKMGAFDFSTLFNHPAVAAAAAAHPAVQAHVAARAQVPGALAIGSPAPAVPPSRPRTSSTTSQGGGY